MHHPNLVKQSLKGALPSLPYDQWKEAKQTLHLYTQVVGKIMLDLKPRQNHWWHITYRVTSRGLTTTPIPYKHITFEIEFDFIDHKLIVRASGGFTDSFSLQDGLSVAQFYTNVFNMLDKLDVKVNIDKHPYDQPVTTPFDKDNENKSYDKEYVHNYWLILAQVDRMFKEFSGWFNGKSSPSQLFWHSFDLAVTRFSGKKAQMEGGRLSDREGYSHECISAGFWPGDPKTPMAAFYAYAYPSPQGLDKRSIEPANAFWIDANGSPMAILKYEDLAASDDPEKDLFDFLESTYQAAADLAGWDIENFKIRPLI